MATTSQRSSARRSHAIRLGVRALGAALAALLLAGAALWLTTELPDPEQLRARAATGGTRLLDRSGRPLYELADPLGGRRRPVPLAEVPLALRQATVAVEDAGFYTNPGLDLRGIARAAWANLRSGRIVAGGSTITQQLARTLVLDPEQARQQTLMRKLREAVLALKLSAAYSKDEILELYLNQTYYGGMAYGVEAAAQLYFGKPVRDLSLAECALLAGLPQAPSRYDPRLNPEAALQRRSQVLAALAREGYITPAQQAAADAEPLQLAPPGPAMRAPHFVLFALDQLAAELGADALARGGLTVTTTLDLGLQEAAQEALRRQIAQLSRAGGGRPDHQVRNGAVVVLDPSDGAILAMVGSPDFADAASQGQVNAALAPRQPGSAIKPLTYAAALERGWTPASILLDVPTSFPTREGRPYAPQNYDRAFHGPLSLREALATSSNVAAVRLLDAIGVPALLEIAERLGITTLGRDSGRYGLALTLGGGEVTLLELTAAYGAFANGGSRVEPYAIREVSGLPSEKVMGSPGDAAEPSFARPLTSEGRQDRPRTQALSPEVAYLIADILSDPYARMRAFGSGGPLDIGRPAAVKTGTTTDWRDNWTVGFTPDRVVGVWIGNADGRPMEQVSGLTGAAPVWRQVMLAAHRGLPPRAFERPAGLVELVVCAEGGLLPSPACPATRPERFIAGTQPTRPDDTHVTLRIDPQRGCRAPDGYPAERTVARTFRLLPPEAELWALQSGLPRPPRAVCPPPATDVGPQAEAEGPPAIDARLSPCNPAAAPACPGFGNGPAVLSPAPGAVFAIAPGVPADRQRIEVVAAASDAAALTIYLDGAPLATFDGPPYRAFWMLRPGRHSVLAEAVDARGVIRRSDEIVFDVR
ncbi:MAG: penicillin-binding protein 1C [Chloroflexota bacterium]